MIGNVQPGRIEYHEKLRELTGKLGCDYFAKIVLRQLITASAGSRGLRGAVVSGARHPMEVEHLKLSFPRTTVVMVVSDYRTRFQRCKERHRAGDPKTIEDFIRNDMLELNTGLSEIGYRMTDRIIFNDSCFAEFAKQIRNLFSEVFG